VLALLLLGSRLTVAQQPVADAQLAQARKQYPGEPAVLLDYREELVVEVVHDSVQVVSRNHFDLLHLAEQSGGYAMDEVYSSYFSRLQTVEARSVVPDGRSGKVLKVKEFKDKFDIRPGVFYDDVRRVSFSFPAVAPGVRTVTDYTIRHPDARFVMPFRFGSYVPVRHAELTVTLPRAARLSYQLFHVPTGMVTVTKVEKGSNVIYRFVAENVPAAPRDDDAPNSAYYQPHVALLINEVPVAGKPRRVLAGIDELYSLYSGFVANADETPGPALRRVVDSLVAGATTPDERARRIYHWVQQHVRYIAFENGLRGFVPSSANRVFANRYGDCKDMANITCQMLRAAGLHAYLAWIGTRDIPYRYAELPAPVVDNHMIAAYEAAPEQYIFLDATGRFTSYGMPTSMIQGKEALLALDPTHCRVTTVPITSAERTTTSDISTVQLDGNGLRGAGERIVTGYAREQFADALEGLDRTRQDRLTQRVLERGNNKFFVDSYELHDVEKLDSPLRMDYKYRLEDYVQRLDDEIYVNLNLERPLAHDRIDVATRRLARTNDFAYTSRTRTTLDVPIGYEVTYLPPAMEVRDSLATGSIRYVHEGSRIVRECELTVDYLMLPPRAFARWNDVVARLSAAYQETVVLKRKKS
jgi:transglutaminase-like putative cysteine protease